MNVTPASPSPGNFVPGPRRPSDAPPPAADPVDGLALSVPSRGLKRVAKTVGAALLGGAFLAVPAAMGLFGGVAGVVGATALGAGIGLYCGLHDGKGARTLATMFGVVGLVASAAGAMGPVGAGVATGMGVLLGLAGDAVNRGTRPGY